VALPIELAVANEVPSSLNHEVLGSSGALDEHGGAGFDRDPISRTTGRKGQSCIVKDGIWGKMIHNAPTHREYLPAYMSESVTPFQPDESLVVV
jgi:hypothetical protein